ncbi:MAG: hypothetical protein FWC36_04105 [Spirochaetes bacterium]|nr:hypothetical protein [Spirochaetota bacterium]
MEDKKAGREKLLIFGIIFIFLGTTLLLVTTEVITNNGLVLSLLVLTLGLSLLHKGFFKTGREIYVLIGMFLSFLGLYLLLRATILDDYGIRRIWPFFMLFTGISFLPYGLKKKKGKRLRIFIPAFAIIFLSLFFLPFSLRLFTMKFLTLAVVWWPLIFIAMGITLIIVFLIKRYGQDVSK